ncbi:MAG TPA: hypothetical protein VLJ11_11220 [Bryobacteraceae bacterium]|nr:hypothetical protein [Bryobacteraceae bacterium]
MKSISRLSTHAPDVSCQLSKPYYDLVFRNADFEYAATHARHGQPGIVKVVHGERVPTKAFVPLATRCAHSQR